MNFNKKNEFCNHMYVGFDGTYERYSIYCDKTKQLCICYEEGLVNTRWEAEEPEDKNKMTDYNAWRLNLELLLRCPHNNKKRKLERTIQRERDVERDFFSSSI